MGTSGDNGIATSDYAAGWIKILDKSHLNFSTIINQLQVLSLENTGGYHQFTTQYTVQGTLISPSNETDEKTGTSLSTTSVGHYTFLARVFFTNVSGNHWDLKAELFYVGAMMDDISFNSGTFISIGGKNFEAQNFTSNSPVLTPGDWKFLGSSEYDVTEGKNSPSTFNLNIHAGVAISNFSGNIAGTGSLNVVAPISKY